MHAVLFWAEPGPTLKTLLHQALPRLRISVVKWELEYKKLMVTTLGACAHAQVGVVYKDMKFTKWTFSVPRTWMALITRPRRVVLLITIAVIIVIATTVSRLQLLAVVTPKGLIAM